jgi:hypothetical protein
MQVVECSAEAGLEQMLEGLSCPITYQLMTDPVVADDGHTYQQHAIEEWINKRIAGMGSEIKDRGSLVGLCARLTHDAYKYVRWMRIIQTSGPSPLHSQGPRWARASSPTFLSDRWFATLYAAIPRGPKFSKAQVKLDLILGLPRPRT